MSGVSLETTVTVRDTCLCLAVQRAARSLAREFDEAFRHLDLTSGQFSLLMALNRPEPAGIGPVARMLAMDRTTLTAALKPLARRGLIEVSTDPRDRRGRLLRLTTNGRRLLARALPIWKRRHRRIERRVCPAGGLREALAELARRDAARRP